MFQLGLASEHDLAPPVVEFSRLARMRGTGTHRPGRLDRNKGREVSCGTQCTNRVSRLRMWTNRNGCKRPSDVRVGAQFAEGIGSWR